MCLVCGDTNQGHSYLLSILNSGVIPAQAGILKHYDSQLSWE